jgi:AcrR family transcriptional regulator
MDSIEKQTSETAQAPRKRNPRGQGAHLREEIIAGATAVLERTGSEDAVSLRAIAREVGIAAPSISRHFTDLTEIIDEVVAEELTGLYQAIVTAAGQGEEPVEQFVRMCHSYVNYARTHPAGYRVLIGRRYLDDWEDRNLTMERTAPIMAAAITLFSDTIQACVDAGDSESTNAPFDTLITWFALHGVIAVPNAITSLEWPDDDLLLEAAVSRSARLTRAPRRDAERS